MNVLLNELSYTSAANAFSEKEIVEILNGLAHAIKFFRLVGKELQVTYWTVDFLIHDPSHVFLNKQGVRSLLSLVGREEKSVLLSMFDKLNFLEIGLTEVWKEVSRGLTTPSFPKFAVTFPHNDGSLSLHCEPLWCGPLIDFVDQNGTVHKVKNFPRISFSGHIPSYVNSVLMLYLPYLSLISPNESFLPMVSVSNVIYSDPAFENCCKNLSPGDRVAAYQIIGSAVAKINQYEESADLNRLNSSKTRKRNIFHNVLLRKFLSIDYETGTFELLDEKGKHLGEYNFQGRMLKKADTKGGHDILLR